MTEQLQYWTLPNLQGCIESSIVTPVGHCCERLIVRVLRMPSQSALHGQELRLICVLRSPNGNCFNEQFLATHCFCNRSIQPMSCVALPRQKTDATRETSRTAPHILNQLNQTGNHQFFLKWSYLILGKLKQLYRDVLMIAFSSTRLQQLMRSPLSDPQSEFNKRLPRTIWGSYWKGGLKISRWHLTKW